MAKYLDNTGLGHFTEKMKGYANGKVGAVDKKVTSHVGNKENPHDVTKTQVGLDKVDNVKQIPSSEKGVANGVATLDAKGKVPTTQIPETMRINGQSIFGSGNITVSTSLYKIVDALPTKDIDITKIYLVPAAASTAKNNKTEYIYIGDPNKAYDETKWEKFGEEQKNTNVDTSEGTIVIDMVLDKTSTHPIANKPVAERIGEIANTLDTKVAKNDYDTAMGTVNSKLKALEDKTITTDSELSESSVNPIQTQAVYKAVQGLETKINNKADTTALTGAVTRITALEKNGATDVKESGEGNGIASIKKVGKDIVATKGTFVTSLTGYVSTGALNTALADYVKSTALASYYTKTEIDGKGYLTEHQSLAGYVNSVEVPATDMMVQDGHAVAIMRKNGNKIEYTLKPFFNTLTVEDTAKKDGNGIAEVSIDPTKKYKLLAKKGKFITETTLGDSIKEYASQQGYLKKEDMKETVTIKLVSDKSESDTGLVGATVTVKSGDTTVSTQTWQGSPISVKVPCDKEVTIEAGVKKMYMKPKALAYVPSPLYNREVTFTYKALETGTYIIDKNDNLYKTTDLFQASGVAYDDALGVLLVTDSIAIVIARTVINEKAWSTGTGLVEGCTTTTDSYSTAIKDFAGAANTAAIIKKHNALDEAAASCNRYIFKNGKKGYLMSVGEALAIQANIDTIGRLLMDIDTGSGNVMSSSEDYWTSTQYDASKAYYVTMSNKRPSSSLKENRRDVVPIYSLYD